MSRISSLGSLLALALLTACPAPEGVDPDVTTDPEAEPELKVDHGVDLETKTIYVGQLNDESGPAAAIGKPFANGKRILAAAINAGDTGLLPEGWKVELVERDHGYNPSTATQAYTEIQDQVLFIGTSFGTPNTLPLRPMLEENTVVAFSASLSSEMANHAHTPPIGPSYKLEAMRAMDFVVEQNGGTEGLVACIVYQKDDYGEDGIGGWSAAAAHHGVEIAGEQTVAAGQTDFTAVVTGLKDTGCTHVMLTTLPSATGPIVGTAAQLEYMPVWIGNTPSWIDKFFIPEVIPSVVFTNFYWVNGLPYWGEEVPGMDTFLAAYDAHGKDLGDPDFYTLVSYIQGLAQIEAARIAIDNGDITRAGYLAALQSIEGWSANGMIQEIGLAEFPYVTGTKTRILKPDFEKKSWTVVSEYAEPAAMGAAAPSE